MKLYFTCGQIHSHPLEDGTTWDKDSVLEVEAKDEDEARDFVFSKFGNEWAFIYSEQELETILNWAPNGVVGKFSTIKQP